MDGEERPEFGGAGVSEGASGGATERYLAIGVTLLVILAAAFLLPGGEAPQEQPQQTDGGEATDGFNTYAQGTEETGTTDAEGAPVGATVEIQEAGVSPTRVGIELGEAVKWENTNDFPVRLSFDRTSQTPTIEPQGTLKMRFRGNTEYDLNNTETGESLAGGEIFIKS